MANEAEKDLNINIRNYIQELNNDDINFMSTIGTKEPRDLHSRGVETSGDQETPIYGKGSRGTGIDIDASTKVLEYFNQSDFNGLIDYWNKSVRDAIKKCRAIIGNYEEDNLILRKDKSVIIKDAANSFFANNEYVAPWKNFTNQNYLEARSDENLDVLTNSKYLDYTQSYNRNTLNDMTDSDEESNDLTTNLKANITLSNMDEEKPEFFYMGVKKTNTGYSTSLTKINTNNNSNNIDVETYCLLEDYSYENEESKQLAEISNSQKMILYILRVLSQSGTKHTELFFEKEIINKNQIQKGYKPNTIVVSPKDINEKEDANNSNDIQENAKDKIYTLLNNIMFTTDEESPAGYDGITWNIEVGNKVGFKTIDDKTIEYYNVSLSIGKTYKNYSTILAALTNLIMPQYRRRVEVEDLNRNFWVISQNLTILNKFMIGLQDGIGKIFQDIFSEIIGLWDNIYSIWKSIFYLDGKINNFDRELNEIGIATSKVKVKIGYENTFYHEDWSRNQEIIKKLFYFDSQGRPADSSGTALNSNKLMLKYENYYFKKGDTKFFGIYPLLYKDIIECKYNLSNSGSNSETASIISLPINSTIHPDRIEELKKNNKRLKYVNNESEIINNIFMDGIGSDGLPYDQTYNSDNNKLGEIIRIERKFGNIKAEDVLEKVRSKNFVLLGYYLKGENKAIDTLSTIINPFMTLLQYLVDLLQKSQQIISHDTTNSTISVIDLGIIANTDFRFCTSITNDIYYVPMNVINSYKFLRDLGIINSSDCTIFSLIETMHSPFNIDNTRDNIFNDTLKDNFWTIFYKIYKYIYDNLYNVKEGEEPRTYAYHINERSNTVITNFDAFIGYKIACNKPSFLPFNKFLLQPKEYTIAVNNSEFDTDVIDMYKYDLERFILSSDILQDNGNVTFCPIYVLFKNMKEFFNEKLSDKKFYYTYTGENKEEVSGSYTAVFPDKLLEDLNINSTIDNEDGTTTKTLSTLEIFDEVFKDFKKIKWDLLSADIIPDHFLEDAKTKTDDMAIYDCSVYKGDELDIKKALIEKMDKSAFFNEGKKGCFGTSHLYPWKNCFGIWFEFIGEPTNTGRPIINADIQSYTHNMCQGNKIIPYPESIMNTGIILSQYNTYNLDITVPIMNVAGYPFDYILRFGKPYPSIVSMLYRKLDSKLNGSTIYDHVKELNDVSNYYYCKYPFINNSITGISGTDKNDRPNTTGYAYDELLYPVDGYYGHENAGQEYGKPQERMYNYIYDIFVLNKMGTIYRRRKENKDISEYPDYNNYFGYTYKDCQKYTISSTDLVNVRDESGNGTSSITGGRTLWKNINMEDQLIANISFLNSSSYNQHIGLYVSKDTTDNNYGIPIEKEESSPKIESPPSTDSVESSSDISAETPPPLEVEYTQGINWAMPPKFQDYFPSEESKKAIHELFTGETLKWWGKNGNKERYLDTNIYCNEIRIGEKIYLAKQQDKITLIPHYLGNQHASNLGDKFFLELYYLTIIDDNIVETPESKNRKEHTFLVSRINYRTDNAYGSKRRWINFPANVLGQIFDNDRNLVRLYNKNNADSGIVIHNSSIWQERYDLFCYFNHYVATLNQSKYVFDFRNNNFNILGELMVKSSVVQEDGSSKEEYVLCTKDNYSPENKDYKLILPTVDITTPTKTGDDDTRVDIADKYKKYYRTYNHYLGTSDNTSTEEDKSNEVYSYASKYTLFLRLKEYDTDDCAYAHIDKYDALKEGQKLVPGFTEQQPRSQRPFSNRMCGWDVESKVESK